MSTDATTIPDGAAGGTHVPGGDAEDHYAQGAADALLPRVRYEQAAAMLCVSHGELRDLVRTGELPVIQPRHGNRPALIEVRALHDLMDRWRARAQREATSRAKSHAGRRKGAA